MQLPSYLEKFINKAVTSLIFPDDPDLNLTAFDMGEDAASMSIDEETVKRLKVNFGDVGAVEMAVPVTINVSIIKVVTPAETWRKRIFTNGLVQGANRTCIFTDDVGNEYSIFACTLSMGEVSANASSPVYNFTVKGTLAVNTDLYGILIG
ncbi:hypothetical protein [Brachyspira pilosicoli]|uniref:Uncharacterized protein n=1 Tax=Brachyspira pilosicoli TaxID=52584 RepID=A0AAJ6G8W2_BRAPL|nr:hypothetical protein [Brachyspira pilosicoli]MBW5391377.1 hypothetical protein [Brachyspira pilosicoli]WIH89355.1 hypothetical protein NEI02_06505 [Brachyspira pilosicoli]WIH91650.1 hypothetical protein NEI01_06505 [Brachyspira pilosicoli]WIH94538.1 hypothetical protein NEH99_09595 [Brachyspira pilosicoli]SUV99497.1 Uncharacterised protein [Brachyspira pilosicoli]